MTELARAGHSLLKVSPLSAVPMTDTLAPAGSYCTSSRVQSAPAPPVEFEQIYREYFPFVWRNARRLGVRESALDDVAQEVFFVVHRRIAGFEARSSVRTWLFGILSNVVRNHKRTVARKPAEADGECLDTVLDSEAQGPEAMAERAEAMATLHRALDSLDDDKREVFVLAELEELTGPEIASALGINLNTVYARLRGARCEFDEAALRERARGTRKRARSER